VDNNTRHALGCIPPQCMIHECFKAKTSTCRNHAKSSISSFIKKNQAVSTKCENGCNGHV
jgi:hypothetical protein